MKNCWVFFLTLLHNSRAPLLQDERRKRSYLRGDMAMPSQPRAARARRPAQKCLRAAGAREDALSTRTRVPKRCCRICPGEGLLELWADGCSALRAGSMATSSRRQTRGGSAARRAQAALHSFPLPPLGGGERSHSIHNASETLLRRGHLNALPGAGRDGGCPRQLGREPRVVATAGSHRVF